MTVLTRLSSKHTFPASVNVKPVDYDSLSSLTSALQGQDALISTLGGQGLATQKLLIDAAVAAKVQRFLPSEFGSDTSTDAGKKIPFFADKAAIQDYLKEVSAKNGLTYSLMFTGPFLDFCIMVGLIMDVPGRSITLYDDGEQAFSSTRLATIGTATANVLKHAEETKNRAVYVQEAALNLKKFAEIGQKVTPGQDWTIKTFETAELERQAYAELKKAEPNHQVVLYGFIKRAIFGKGFGSHFEKLDNELLGIPEMSEAEVETLVASYVK